MTSVGGLDGLVADSVAFGQGFDKLSPNGAVWPSPNGAVWPSPNGAVWPSPNGAVWPSPNGAARFAPVCPRQPFALSLSKGWWYADGASVTVRPELVEGSVVRGQGFDKLSPNGAVRVSPNGKGWMARVPALGNAAP